MNSTTKLIETIEQFSKEGVSYELGLNMAENKFQLTLKMETASIWFGGGRFSGESWVTMSEGNLATAIKWIETTHREYKLKGLRTVHGYELPDISIKHLPKIGTLLATPSLDKPQLFDVVRIGAGTWDVNKLLERGLLYEYSEIGIKVAILHTRILLDIVESNELIEILKDVAIEPDIT